MDRFIAFVPFATVLFQNNLKSNMDRFIDGMMKSKDSQISHLKSNMDRFIVIRTYISMAPIEI